MFTSSADFSYISTSGAGKLKVSDIKHKTFVNIDENGTEATGVTGKNDDDNNNGIDINVGYYSIGFFVFSLVLKFEHKRLTCFVISYRLQFEIQNVGKQTE